MLTLQGWFDDAVSAINDGAKAARNVCNAVNSSTGQAVQAAGGAILPTSASNVMNKGVEYLNQGCSILNPSTATPNVPAAGSASSTSSTSAYPKGSIAAYFPKKGGYEIAVPSGPTGSLNLTLEGVSDLGAAYIPTKIMTAVPPGVTQVSTSQYNKAVGKWYTTWWFKTLVGVGGVGIVGTVAWIIIK